MFGHMLQQKINRDFQTDWSDHFIVSKDILKTVCLFSVPSLFQFIGVTDREFYYQQGL